MPKKLLDLNVTRRNAILNAALKEFALRGFEKASTNVIAKDAGISKALMFHYVNSKQDLFKLVCDYFIDLLDKEYYSKMDYSEQDVFSRLHQSYLLQINLIKQYPWILDFNKLFTAADSVEININQRENIEKLQSSCNQQMFNMIDTSKFKVGLNIGICKQVIYWSNIGFTNQLLDENKNSTTLNLDENNCIARLEEYIDGLRNIFYTSGIE